MDTAPKFQRLYVGLVKAIVLHAYRVGFEVMLPKTPLPDFIEDGTIIIEFKELRQTILPAVGDLFSHSYSSPSEHISNLLPRIGLTERFINESGPFKGRPSHVSKFLVSYEDIADFVVSKQAWSSLSLEGLAGAYFEIYHNRNMLAPQYFRPRGDQVDIAELFHDAGFMERDGYLYRWNEDVLKTHIYEEMWFADGVPEFDKGDDQ